MENFELAILLTTAGAAVGAALIKTLVSAAKGLGWVPDHGRGIMYAVLAFSVLLIGLAIWDADWIADGVTAGEVFLALLSLAGLYTAAIGMHETAVKVQNIAQGTTNPTGPDAG